MNHVQLPDQQFLWSPWASFLSSASCLYLRASPGLPPRWLLQTQIYNLMLWDRIHPGLRLWTSVKAASVLSPIWASGPLSVVCCVTWWDSHLLVMTKANEGVSLSAFPRPPVAITPGSPFSFSSLTKFHKDSTQTPLYYFHIFVTLTFLSHLVSLTPPMNSRGSHLPILFLTPSIPLGFWLYLSWLLSQWHRYMSMELYLYFL